MTDKVNANCMTYMWMVPPCVNLELQSHLFFQRGLSESFKDVPLGLDGSTLRAGPQGGGEQLMPRSLSLSGHHPQHAGAAHNTSPAPRDSKVKPFVGKEKKKMEMDPIFLDKWSH